MKFHALPSGVFYACVIHAVSMGVGVSVSMVAAASEGVQTPEKKQIQVTERTAGSAIEYRGYRVPHALLKDVHEADGILYGIKLTDEERVVYHPETFMLMVNAGKDAHVLIGERIDRLQASPRTKGKVVSSELAQAMEKVDSEFSWITPDRVREYLRQVDELIQAGKYAEARKLLKLCEDRVQKELDDKVPDEVKSWMDLQAETVERRMVLALKLKQGPAVAEVNTNKNKNKMPMVPPPAMFNGWEEKSRSFQFNGEMYYKMPLTE